MRGTAEPCSRPRSPAATATTPPSSLDCFLATPDGDPGYRLSATFGPYAKSYREAGDSSEIHGDAGFDKEESYARATARCPGSSQRALFTLWSVLDSANQETITHPSPEFERAALAAFAKKPADQRGCADLRLPH
ncbi:MULTISPECIES: hypothetical protein [unclassified Streptomyces]|uniref:hypothetical protein n=1 Tax=unclassified Streptomyces TaxID=2593676 RepID=UPI002E11D6AA|nr:hypothetical protein OG533_04605 [Streptomyces sp. NBC_01186]WSS39979.1 hypothetical protein OG220_04705 [Streptomyces sp. NBC_01187]